MRKTPSSRGHAASAVDRTDGGAAKPPAGGPARKYWKNAVWKRPVDPAETNGEWRN